VAGEGDGDFFSSVGGAPDRNGFVTLENGVVVKQKGGNDISANGSSETQKRQAEKGISHINSRSNPAHKGDGARIQAG
jgi:hypothetical protein